MFFSGFTRVYPSCSIGLISDSRNHMILVYGDHLVCRDAASVENLDILIPLFICGFEGLLEKDDFENKLLPFCKGKAPIK